MSVAAKKSKLIPGAKGDWEVVIGMEVHAHVTSKAKLFSGASTEFGGEPNSPRLAGGRRDAGDAAGDQRLLRRAGGAHGARAESADQQEIRVRPEELFLSRPAAGLPDQPVQEPGGGRGPRARRHARRRDRGRHRAAASGAGRRQVDPRPASEPVAGRSQSLRRRADGDRVEARPALGRRRQGVSHQAARDPALPRHLRRRHGEGLAARRRERVGAQARRRARHALRDQEHEFDPLHRPGDRVRGAAADRNSRGRRQDRAGDAAVRSGQARDALHAQQGRGARLPLFPRSRSVAARIRRCVRGQDRSLAAGTAGREEGALREELRAFGL